MAWSDAARAAALEARRQHGRHSLAARLEKFKALSLDQKAKLAFPNATVHSPRRRQRTNMWTNVNATNPLFKTRGY